MRWLFAAMLVSACAPSPRAIETVAAPLHIAVFSASNVTSLDAPWEQSIFDYRAYTADVPTGFVFRPRSDRPELREWFRLRAEGSFTVARPGAHLFYVTSDDGARVSIAGRLVVDNAPALHALQSVVGSVDLAAGRHTIEVEYLQGPQLMELSLRCVRPDGTGGTFDTRIPW